MKTMAHIIYLAAGIALGAIARPRRKHRAWTAPHPLKDGHQ